MGTYKPGTVKLTQALQSGKVKVVKRNEEIVVTGEGFNQRLPRKGELATQALRRAEWVNSLSAEDKKLLASRTGKNVSVYSHNLNDNKSHMASKNDILCATLMRKEIPSAENVSHTLLSMEREELFTGTWDRSVNCRNLLLRLCLDYAHDPKNVCPVADWLVFTNSVILWFNKSMTGKPMEALEVGAPDYSFVATHAELLADWEKQLSEISYCNPFEYRNQLLEAYKKKNKLSCSTTEIKKHLCDAAYCDDRNADHVFSKNLRRCSRDLLIEMAIAMGCNLKETNLLLRQVSWAALYANKALDEGRDAEYIKRLSPEGLGIIKEERNDE